MLGKGEFILPAPTFENLQARCFEELRIYFRSGTAHGLEEMTGDTKGAFLAWNPQAGCLMKIWVRWMLQAWPGRGSVQPRHQAVQRRFHHALCFSDVPRRSPHGRRALSPVGLQHTGSLRDLIDDVRRVADGLVLINHKFVRQRDPTFYLYFTLQRKG
jgi:hypothetical protein